MHGLINRSFQTFVVDTYGPAVWMRVALRSGLDPDGFEPMLTYDDSLTEAVLAAAGLELSKTREVLLEDLGTYIVSPRSGMQRLRRLLRFGGATFADFLHSLDELPDRARLAVPGLEVPSLELIQNDAMSFELRCRWRLPGVGHAMLGLLRTLADDYGVLAMLELVENGPEVARLGIELIDDGFAEGRDFNLASGV